MTEKPGHAALEKRVQELEQQVLRMERTLEALHLSEERFRKIFEESPIGIELYDAKGRLVDANSACLDIFGVSDIAHVKGFLLFEDPNVSDEVKDRLRKGETVRYEMPFDFERVKKLRLYETTKSGIIHVDVMITPLGAEEKGSAEGFLAQVQDVTEGRVAAEALRESEEKYRTLAECANDAIIVVQDRKTVYHNSAYQELIGCGAAEAEDKIFSEFIVPEDRDRVCEFYQRRIRGEGAPGQYEVSVISSGGEIVDLEVKPRFIYYQGRPASLAIMRDITERKLMEKRLQEKITWLNSFINNLPDMAWLKDADSRFIAVNRAFGEIVGMAPEFLLSETCEVCFGKEAAKNFREDDQKVMQGKRRVVFEEKVLDAGGNVVWLETVKSPILNESGEVLGTVGIARDITKRKRLQAELETARDELEARVMARTAELASSNEELKKEIEERKRAEQALRESEANYRNLVETMNEGLGVTDEKYVFTYVNEKFADMLGCSKKEMIDHHLLEFVAPDFKDFMAQQIAERKLGGAGRYELVWNDKEGRRIHTLISPKGLFDSSSRFAGSFGVLTDITELKNAEEALRESEAKYRHLFDMESDAIFLIDSETGQILEANAAASALYGYTRKELLGKKNTDLSAEPEDTRAATLEHRSRVPVRYHRKKDGTVFVVEITASHFVWRGREVHVAAMRDITFRIEAEKKTGKLQAQLQHAQKLEAIGTLAGGVAHDFNNLLMGIQGSVSLMLMDLAPEHPDYERLKNMEKQVRSGARLTSLLLGYARKGRYEVKPVDLNQLVQEACETFGRTKKDITIHQESAPDLYPIEADPGQLEQVFFNLCVNAADAMPEGGVLTVRTRNTTHEVIRGKLYKPKPGSYVMLEVTDTGLGMDEKTMERIFDPFFTTKEMGHGTGLGLASAYGIIKAHGGYIEVDSTLGKGTTFSIYLPRSEKTVERAEKLDTQLVKGTETILLVDDEDPIRHVGKELLEALGYRVKVASDGKEAVEMYRDQADGIDLVLLDIVMPGMGGGETYDRMKEINPGVKVLLLSGFSIDDHAAAILKRGCKGFIQKPFDMKELSGRIREILDNK